MADDPAPNPSPGEQPDEDPSYFCYQCNKEVTVEGSQGGMTCTECNGGFLEAITTANPEFHRPARRTRRRRSDPTTVSLSDALEHMYPHQMLQMVQILLEAGRNNRAAQPGNSSIAATAAAAEEHGDPIVEEGGGGENVSEDGESDGTGGLRLELEAFDLNDEEDEWEEAEDEEHVAAAAAAAEGGGGVVTATTEAPGEDTLRRARSNFNFYMRELFQSLLEQNVEVRVELPDLYLGNPGDYLDSVGFEQLLQQLAESDSSRRGAPPAAKSAVEMLETVRITQRHVESGIAVCAVCKEQLTLEEPVKQLPCMHLYHPDCILPWLGARNSCPVCRYELPTDDPDYEEQKRGRKVDNSGGTEDGRESSTSDGSTSSSVSTSEEACSETGHGSSSGGGHQRGVSRSWMILAIGPVLSVMGFVFITLANHLVGRQVMEMNVLEAGGSGATAVATAARHWWSFH